MTRSRIERAATAVYLTAAAAFAGLGVLVTLGGLLMLATGWPN